MLFRNPFAAFPIAGRFSILALLSISPAAALAQDGRAAAAPETNAAVLSGGASSITETHGDWVVNCRVVSTAKICSFSQQQFDQRQGNQRLLAVEFTTENETSASGTIALPFGLALARGITLSIDDQPVEGTHSFSTCLPVGCLVPVSLDAAMIERLETGQVLKIEGFTLDNGQPISFSVPLRGFGSALSRTLSLSAG